MSMSLEENHFKTTKHGWENVSLLVCSGNVDTKDHTAPWFYNICSLLKKVIFDDEYLGRKKNCQATFKKNGLVTLMHFVLIHLSISFYVHLPID